MSLYHKRSTEPCQKKQSYTKTKKNWVQICKRFILQETIFRFPRPRPTSQMRKHHWTLLSADNVGMYFAFCINRLGCVLLGQLSDFRWFLISNMISEIQQDVRCWYKELLSFFLSVHNFRYLFIHLGHWRSQWSFIILSQTWAWGKNAICNEYFTYLIHEISNKSDVMNNPINDWIRITD